MYEAGKNMYYKNSNDMATIEVAMAWIYCSLPRLILAQHQIVFATILYETDVVITTVPNSTDLHISYYTSSCHICRC